MQQPTSSASANPSGLPRLMTIFAHPDDETFSAAGFMGRATAAGHPVAIVSATRGEVGEIARPELAAKENLGQVREQELRNAAAAVGVSDVSFLGYIDGQVQEANREEAVGRIVAHLRRFRPDVIVTFAANGGYGHVDHVAIHHFALAAVEAAANPAAYPEQVAAGLAPHRVRKVYFSAMPRSRMMAMREQARAEGGDFTPGGNAATIPIEEMGTPDEAITTRVELTPEEFQRKLAAVQAHATQLPAENYWARMTPEQLYQLVGIETFQLMPPPLSDGDYPSPERDLFAGL